MQQSAENKTSEVTENFIDLEKIFAAKNIKAPKWAIRLLSRMLHVKKINRGLYVNRDKYGAEFATAILDYLNIKVVVEHGERIPTDGNPIIVGNHPLGGPDGMALIAAVGTRRNDIVFPVNDFLTYIPGLQPITVPIDKVHGNRNTADAINAAFAADNALLYFPAGICSRRTNGEIRDLEWKPTVIKKSIIHHRDIIPVFIDARNRRRFYTIANLRKNLGIKFNYEMALLPGEMFAQSGKTFRIIVGEPIPWKTFSHDRSAMEWADWLKGQTYHLNDKEEDND